MGGSYQICKSSAMISNRTRQGPSSSPLKNRHNPATRKSGGIVCTHCGESNHSKQRCYEIIGYPDWWDFTKKPQKNIGAMLTSTEGKQVQPTANVVHLGILVKASVLSVTSKNSTWIIDIGASNHMIRDSAKLKSLKPHSQSVISTTNGSTSPITRVGAVGLSITLSDSLTLDIVLVVPSLKYNLLSVSQITSTLACTVTLWPFFFVYFRTF